MLAEPGDDISTLDIPAEAISTTPESNESSSSSSTVKEIPESPSTTAHGESAESIDTATRSSSDPSSLMRYPFYPSVSQLLHENGLSKSDADAIPTTGPNGRLLKGDVLAYLGAIRKSYPREQSNRIAKLGHLDLSNIRIMQSQRTEDPSTEQQNLVPPPVDQNTEVTVNISLKAVTDVQQRVKAALGIEIPLDTFISRAVEISNTNLPQSRLAPLSTNVLFNQILGLDNVKTETSRGSFIPQVTAFPAHVPLPKKHSAKGQDIIDCLAMPSSISEAPPKISRPMWNSREATNIFSVETRKGDERRAKVFLERVKTVLQMDPGRLIV